MTKSDIVKPEYSNKRDNRRIGSFTEAAAVSYLSKNGYTILKKNYRFSRYGEVDIIAEKDDYVCFIEVKSRKNDAFGTPAEAVTQYKKNKIAFIAGQYLAVNKIPEKTARFDVIEIYLTHSEDGIYNIKSINHIENAF